MLSSYKKNYCPTEEPDDPLYLIQPKGVEYVTKTFVTGYKKGKEEFSCPIPNSGENVYNRLGSHKKSSIKYYNVGSKKSPPLYELPVSKAYTYEKVNPEINRNQQLYQVQPNTVYYSSGLGNTGAKPLYDIPINKSFSYRTPRQGLPPIYATAGNNSNSG